MIDLPMASLPQNERMGEDERQVSVGFGFCHNEINTLARQLVAASTQVSALASILTERGLLTNDELETQQAEERKRLMSVLNREDFGVAISEEFPDKYDIPADKLPKIDCEARLPLCGAACCSMRFALSTQDLDEGVVRWEYGQPYLIRHDNAVGRCVHQDPDDFHCGVYEKRPAYAACTTAGRTRGYGWISSSGLSIRICSSPWLTAGVARISPSVRKTPAHRNPRLRR